MGLYYTNGEITDNPYKRWQSAYALFPRKIKGRWVWLDTYYWRYRSREYEVDYGYTDTRWVKEYGDIFDTLKGKE